MATIKDVAKLADVSPSTVSIVAANKCAERKIPDATRDRVLKAMEILKYRPNRVARRLRSDEHSRPTIALYWPLDMRSHQIGRVLLGMQSEIEDYQSGCEIIVQPYTNNFLHKDPHLLKNDFFDGIIIGAPSFEDTAYLESIQPLVPTIIYNRRVKNYNCVYADNEAAMSKLTSILSDRGYKSVGILTSNQELNNYLGMSARKQVFIDYCRSVGIDVKPSMIQGGDNTHLGGYEAIKNMYATQRVSGMDILFCNSDIMALGACKALRELDIQIPQKLAVVSMGFLDEEFTKFAIPSLSVLQIPYEKMASEAIKWIKALLDHRTDETDLRCFDIDFLLRETF